MRGKLLMAFAFVAFMTVVATTTGWSQSITGGRRGTIIKDEKPQPDLQLVFTDPRTGKQYKGKTDKKGEYSFAGMVPGQYTLEISGPDKQVIYSEAEVTIPSEKTELHDIDLSHPELSKGTAGPLPKAGGKLSKEEAAKMKAENEKISSMNAQLTAAQSALQAQNWPEAEKNLSQVISKLPNTTHWEFYRALGEAQKNQNKNDEAIQTYTKGIQIAQGLVDGSLPKDNNNPYSDPAKAKMGMGAMLTSRGNLYLKEKKNSEAIADYKKAAESDPNPAIAYYNLCAVEYNSNQYDAAAADCGKSTAADPSKADAWFFQGAALAKASKPGAADALNKYLQLDPNGAHAAEAKGMIQK